MVSLTACSSRVIKHDDVDDGNLKKYGIYTLQVKCIDGYVKMEKCKNGVVGFTKMLFKAYKRHELFGRKASYAKLEGLKGPEGWILQPHYTDIAVWRTDYAFAKRFGENTYRYIDLNSKSDRQTDYKKIQGGLIYVSENKNEPGKYIFLGEDGKPEREIKNAKSLWFMGSSGNGPNIKQPFVGSLKSADSPVVIRHEDKEVGTFDVIYSSELIPMSPPLPGVRRVHGIGTGQFLVGIELDDKKELFWPLLPDTTMVPQPEDLVGVKVLASIRTPSGDRVWWGVKWQTEEGPRWAVITAPHHAYIFKKNRVLEGVLASKAKAFYRDEKVIFNRVVTYGNKWNKAFVLSRIDGSENYFVFEKGSSEPIEGEVYQSESAARTEYRKRTNQRLAVEAEERRKYWARQKALLEASRKASAERTAKLSAERSAREFKVSQLRDQRKYAEAAQMAREFGSERVKDIVVYAVKFGDARNIAERDLRVAHSALPALSIERGKIAKLIKQKENARWREQQAQRRAQPAASSSGYQYSSPTYSRPKSNTGNQKSYPDIMKEMRFRQTIRYLKGHSNWHYGN